MLINAPELEEAIEPEMAAGCLSVLNVGAGDLKFTFDKGNPIDTDRAKRVICDMLARGYIIFVETGDGLRRATGFDPELEVYILSDVPGTPLRIEPVEPEIIGVGEQPEKSPKRRGRPSKTTVPLKSTKATAIAPTSGG